MTVSPEPVERPKLSFYEPAGVGVADCIHFPPSHGGNVHKRNRYEMDWEKMRRDQESRMIERRRADPGQRGQGELSVGEVLHEDPAPPSNRSSSFGLRTPGERRQEKKLEGMLPVSVLLKHGNKHPKPCVAHPKQPHVHRIHYQAQHPAESFHPYRTVSMDAFGQKYGQQKMQLTTPPPWVIPDYVKHIPGKAAPDIPHPLGRAYMLPHP